MHLVVVNGNGTFIYFDRVPVSTNRFASPVKPNPEYKGTWYAPLIDNPDYKGEWAPRRIVNRNWYEDLTPVRNLNKIGGVGIELWTMTEDILFDNIYVGHSIENAKEFAAETFDIKKPAEAALGKVDEPFDGDEDEITWKEDPIAFVRQKVLAFADLAKLDPVFAFKTHPETGAALAAALFTLLGMIGALFGLVGGQQQPVITKSSKKTDAPTADDKPKSDDKAETDAAPVAPAGEDKKKKKRDSDDGHIKKRK